MPNQKPTFSLRMLKKRPKTPDCLAPNSLRTEGSFFVTNTCRFKFLDTSAHFSVVRVTFQGEEEVSSYVFLPRRIYNNFDEISPQGAVKN